PHPCRRATPAASTDAPRHSRGSARDRSAVRRTAGERDGDERRCVCGSCDFYTMKSMDLAYTREGSGPPVLLIHGVGGDATNWSAIASRLSDRFELIAMDLRGHGKSELIRGPLRVEDFAHDAVEVLDAAGVERCSVVGFSLGGAVAQALTLGFP